jgi:alcohol dehydrogenase (cytochrome c)
MSRRALLFLLIVPLFALSSAVARAQTGASDAVALGRGVFELHCGGCHGGDGPGGERGPDVVTPGLARRRSDARFREIVTGGLIDRGMPPFDLSAADLDRLTTFYRSRTAPAGESPVAGDVAAGRKFFLGKNSCGACHAPGLTDQMVGPDLSVIAAEKTLPQIEQALKEPGRTPAAGYEVVTVKLKSGGPLRGFLRNESAFSLQLQDFRGAMRFVRREDVSAVERDRASVMPAFLGSDADWRNLLAYLTRLEGSAEGIEAGPDTSLPGSVSFAEIKKPRRGDWPSYNGLLSGNRHSELDQIHTGNVAGLAPRWMFPIRSPRRLQVTPVVIDGVMYVTTVNEAFALDAANGREIWHYRRGRTEGVIGDAGSGINRGVAVLGDRVFMVTDDARVIALHRLTGRLLWDTKMAAHEENYGSTLAPLVVNDLVIAGVAGGDEGIRGFLAAYSAATGEEVWRFWTIPAPGEPGSETWVGSALPHGCGATWLTGSYDPELDLLYWTTGNPCPDYNGDERKGDNLYSNSVVALEPAAGNLRWYYQYTPHGLNDWDAVQTPVLADAEWQGERRKLLLQANRNGFFYVLDREDGELLLAEPFVDALTWASRIGEDGRPVRVAGQVPTPGGTVTCPAVEGATNWMSPAFHPGTGLFYLNALEKCSVYIKRPQDWTAGDSFYGGTTRIAPDKPKRKYLRAIDIETGKRVWEREQVGPARAWGGVLTTAGGLVLYGDDSGAFAAVDAKSGEPLWDFQMNVVWKASPMTYEVGGRQYIAVAADRNIVVFGLPDW